MASTTTKKKSEQIKEDLAFVRIVARTGRLPIISDSEEYIGPGIPPRKIPGVTLEFGDNGVCELDPIRDAATIKAFDEWMAEGTDPRIVDLGVMVMARDALVPPFPKWDSTNDRTCLEMIETLGLDVTHCLRYELQRGSDARPKLVKQLEAKVDEPVAEDADADPILD